MSLYGDLPPAKGESSRVGGVSLSMAPPIRKLAPPPPLPRKPRSVPLPPKFHAPAPVVKEKLPSASQPQSFQPPQPIAHTREVFSKVIDEYDPSRPNDYEEFCAERERLKQQDIEQRRANRERERYLEQQQQQSGGGGNNGFAMPNKKSKLDLNITADEAYNRRKAMSAPQPMAAPPPMGPPTGFKPPSSLPPGQGSSSITQNLTADGAYGGGQNTSSPTRVVLLRNMVGRGEVDGMLSREVTEECSKYGRVAKVVVHEMKDVPDSQSVRIFVHFGSIKAAVTALQDLNGRFFGGRKVLATYYSELKLTMKDYTS